MKQVFAILKSFHCKFSCCETRIEKLYPGLEDRIESEEKNDS